MKGKGFTVMSWSIGARHTLRRMGAWLVRGLYFLVLLILCLHPLADVLSAAEQGPPASATVERPISALTSTCRAVSHAAVVPDAPAVDVRHPISYVSPPSAPSVTPLHLAPSPLPPR